MARGSWKSAGRIIGGSADTEIELEMSLKRTPEPVATGAEPAGKR